MKRMYMHIPGFMRTHSFSYESTQSFMHLAPGVSHRGAEQLEDNEGVYVFWWSVKGGGKCYTQVRIKLHRTTCYISV